MYIYQRTIRLQDTDAAGVLFFANQFLLFHEAFESLFDSIGLNIAVMIKDKEYALPIVHAEADYTVPLTVGDNVEIQLTVDNVGETSFSLLTKVIKSDQTVGTVKTVHVSIDAQSGKKIPLPAVLREKIVLINK